MRLEVTIPVTNREGKALVLALDTDTDEVSVTTPPMFRTPTVSVAALSEAIHELRRGRQGAAPATVTRLDPPA
jgi:hypothetical protein